MQTQTEQISSERSGCLGRLLPVIIGLENARRGPAGGKAWFEITRHQFHFARHSQAFHGYRLVHITDLHIDNMFMTPERVANFVEAVNKLHADAVLITGDFVQDYQSNYAQTFAGLSALQAKDGVFGVLGNHDHYAGAAWVRECLQAAHIQELNDATHTIQRGDEMLHLVGLDDLLLANRDEPAPISTHLPRLERLAASLPAEGTAVLLVHEPDIADVAASAQRFDLQLSGHSHGGQVRIPFYGLLSSILPPLARQYPRGLYQVEKMILYTNRGLGTPLRINTPAEIAVIDLYQKSH
jgi:uncharacterized protein